MRFNVIPVAWLTAMSAGLQAPFVEPLHAPGWTGNAIILNSTRLGQASLTGLNADSLLFARISTDQPSKYVFDLPSAQSVRVPAQPLPTAREGKSMVHRPR